MSKNAFGSCPLCPKSSPPRKLLGGYCSHHFSHPDDDQSNTTYKKEARAGVVMYTETQMAAFLREQLQHRPEFCENGCGKKLVSSVDWVLKSMVCHILPKRKEYGFPSVALNPYNIWYGCPDCHHEYDDNGWSHAVTMPVWETCVQRFKEFMHLLTVTEHKHLPAELREILEASLVNS